MPQNDESNIFKNEYFFHYRPGVKWKLSSRYWIRKDVNRHRNNLFLVWSIIICPERSTTKNSTGKTGDIGMYLYLPKF